MRIRAPFVAGLLLLLVAVLLPVLDADAQNQPPATPLADRIEAIAGVLDPDPNAVTNWLAEEAAVWDIEVIGNTVYVGGTFTTVAEKYDEARHPHSYLAAFDGTTGDWIDWWLPQLDGPVYSLDSTTSGDLLVGGEFLTVNGQQGHAGLVALDATTFQIDTSFRSNVERRWTTDPMVVRDLFTVADRLYVTGNFNHVNNTRVYKAVRMDRTSGTVDTTFLPRLSGRTAYAIAESPDGQRVHIGGQFDAVDAQPDTALLATVNASDGQLVAGWDWNFSTFCCKDPKILALAVYGDNLFVAGSNDFWAMISSTDGTTRRLVPQAETQDPQVVEVFGDRVYIGCHCSKRGDWMSAIDGATGQDLESFSSDWTGSDGGWAVAIAPDGCIWSGGAFDSGLRADGDRVFAGNLVRTCPAAGPIPHNETVITHPIPFTCTVLVANGTTTISWTDRAAAGYDLSHDGGPARWVTGTWAHDATPGLDYTVTAWGSDASGEQATCVNPDPGGGNQFTCSVTVAANGTTTVSWTDIGATGYDLSHDGEVARWVTATSAIDATPGLDYTVTAWGGGVSGETTRCVNPNPGGGLQFACTVVGNIDGSSTISWTDLGATGYDISADGGPARWVAGTTTVDTTGAATFTIVAWGNGLGGETTSC